MSCPQCLHCAEVAKAARAQGKGPFVPMRDLFVAKWETKYRAKYLFEPQDAVQLNAMIKRHDGLMAAWPDIVDRYLAEPFWGGKRHPLRVLATRPGEFSVAKVAMPRVSPATADLFATDRKIAEYRAAQRAPAPSLESLRALREGRG